MEDPTGVGKFAAFSVNTCIPFLKDACAFVPPFRSCRVLAGPHDKERCACNKLADDCVDVFLSACKCGGLDFTVKLSDV